MKTYTILRIKPLTIQGGVTRKESKKSMKHWLGRKTNASSSVLRILRICNVRMSPTMVMVHKCKCNPTGYYSHSAWLLHVSGREQSAAIDSMVSEWKQNHWRNQGKQCVTFFSCPSVFHRLICIAQEKGVKYLAPLIQAQPLPLKTANSEVNHTSPPVSYPEYGKYKWEWSNSVLKRSQVTECLYKLDCFWHL